MWHKYPSCVASWGNVFFFNQITYRLHNNLAEYEAVHKGMELLLEVGAEAVEFFWRFKICDL
jgi:hypothetical protein